MWQDKKIPNVLTTNQKPYIFEESNYDIRVDLGPKVKVKSYIAAIYESGTHCSLVCACIVM